MGHLQFESIGGSSNTSQYSLYDYDDSHYGETIMSIEIHHESKNWWFTETKSVMKIEHMKALRDFLIDKAL